MVGVVLFVYLGIMGYDVAVLQHNLTLIQETTREAAWVAARAGSDERVLQMIDEAGQRLVTGAFLQHTVKTFALEIRSDTWGEMSLPWQTAIAPNHANLEQDSTFAPGIQNRAAHVYRTQGYVVRIGVRYVISMGAPMFGVFRPFTVSMPIVANEPITVRNDEDRDGLADLYEQEVFARVGYMTYAMTEAGLSAWGSEALPWPRARSADAETLVWYPFSHLDTGARIICDGSAAALRACASQTGYGVTIALSDATNDNIDGDTLSNASDVMWPHAMYDHDNDGIEDRFDFTTSMPTYRDPTDTTGAATLPPADSPQLLAHPVFGGRAKSDAPAVTNVRRTNVPWETAGGVL